MDEFPRIINLTLKRSSLFLFGPRMCGKTTLLKKIPDATYFDLLDPTLELTYKTTPQDFWQELQLIDDETLVIVDEIQRVPALLDYVQMGIDQKKLIFILSGSSARKLKRGGANLLGGRAIEKRLYPLTVTELRDIFNIDHALNYGTLPRISSLLLEGEFEECREILKSYYVTYLKEEVQAEALTRNVPAFSRFLKVAAQSHGQIIEYANIGRASKVADSTVKEYFSILEDTLIGFFLYQWDASERKKSRAKFYFFDSGVVRAIQNRLYDPPTGQETEWLFEAWFINEVVRLKEYSKPYLELSFWQSNNHEVDLLIKRGEKYLLAVEIKSGINDDLPGGTAERFKKQFPETELIVASKNATRAKLGSQKVRILPWKDALTKISEL